jgi:hypothetical protein
MLDPLAFFGRADAYAERLRHVPQRPGPLAWAGAALCAALLAATVVVMYRSMRLVMEIGGSCASGGPYEIATPCPSGAVPLMTAAFPVGFLAAGGFAAFAWKLGRGAAGLLVLAWPALFVSLGWNFLEYAFDPPGGGVVGGWLVCGVIFWLMGLPVLLALPRIVRGIEERRVLVLCVLTEAALAGAVGGWFLVEAVAG